MTPLTSWAVVVLIVAFCALFASWLMSDVPPDEDEAWFDAEHQRYLAGLGRVSRSAVGDRAPVASLSPSVDRGHGGAR